jgi:hypothetical protein
MRLHRRSRGRFTPRAARGVSANRPKPRGRQRPPVGSRRSAPAVAAWCQTTRCQALMSKPTQPRHLSTLPLSLSLSVTSVPDAKKGERLVVLYTELVQTLEAICCSLAAGGLPPLWIRSPDSFRRVPGHSRPRHRQAQSQARQRLGRCGICAMNKWRAYGRVHSAVAPLVRKTACNVRRID